MVHREWRIKVKREQNIKYKLGSWESRRVHIWAWPTHCFDCLSYLERHIAEEDVAKAGAILPLVNLLMEGLPGAIYSHLCMFNCDGPCCRRGYSCSS